MSTKKSKIYFEKIKAYCTNFNLKISNKNITSIFAILMLLIQYMVVPVYATLEEGKFNGYTEFPFDKKDIEFQKISTQDVQFLGIDIKGNLWASGINTKKNLGIGDSYPMANLVQVKKGTTFKDVSLGWNFSLAIDTRRKFVGYRK